MNNRTLIRFLPLVVGGTAFAALYGELIKSFFSAAIALTLLVGVYLFREKLCLKTLPQLDVEPGKRRARLLSRSIQSLLFFTVLLATWSVARGLSTAHLFAAAILTYVTSSTVQDYEWGFIRMCRGGGSSHKSRVGAVLSYTRTVVIIEETVRRV